MTRLEELLAVGDLLVRMQLAGVSVFHECDRVNEEIFKELDIKDLRCSGSTTD